MIDQQKLYEIWVYLQAEPLFWLTLTIGMSGRVEVKPNGTAVELNDALHSNN